MTAFTVEWSCDESLPTRRPTIQVLTVAELDAALDQVRGVDGMPVVVDVLVTGGGFDDPALQIGLGLPGRASVQFFDDAGGAWGYEPGLPPYEGTAQMDYGGEPTEYGSDRLRVTPAAAREAAREYVRTGGQRPTCVAWDTDA